MEIIEGLKLLRSVYLGDRAINSLTIDYVRSVVGLEVDVISRIRSPTGNWEFYTAEDIENGAFVFEGVRYCKISPDGSTPHEGIYSANIEEDLEKPGYLKAVFEVGGRDALLNRCVMKIEVSFRKFYLQDPLCPSVQIS